MTNKISQYAGLPSLPENRISDEASSFHEQLTKKDLALEKAGVTRPLLYSRLTEGLNAVKKRIGSDDCGEPIEIEEPDLIIRHKYLDTALRVFGDLKDNSVAVGVSVNMAPEERALLDAYRKNVVTIPSLPETKVEVKQ